VARYNTSLCRKTRLCSTGPGCSAGTGRAVALEHALDVTQRLPDALLILDQADTDIALAIIAETDTRRHRHLGFTQQQFAEFQRAQVLIRLRNRRPGKHRRLWLVDRPAALVET